MWQCFIARPVRLLTHGEPRGDWQMGQGSQITRFTGQPLRLRQSEQQRNGVQLLRLGPERTFVRQMLALLGLDLDPQRDVCILWLSWVLQHDVCGEGENVRHTLNPKLHVAFIDLHGAGIHSEGKDMFSGEPVEYQVLDKAFWCHADFLCS